MAKGLGRGLGALLKEDAIAATQTTTRSLRLSEIEPNPNQPRRVFDEEKLNELAASIKTDGLLQPITVRKTEDGYYQIIAGERRWRAARIAGISEVPVTIIEADDRRVAELALIENLQREDLNPIEEAEGFGRLAQEYGMTQEEIAKTVGRSRPAVANALRLLGLPQQVRDLVADGSLSAGHARTLLGLDDPETVVDAAMYCVQTGISVRGLEQYVKALTAKKKEKPVDTGLSVNYFEDIERRLASRLGRKITFHAGKKKGRVEIEYYDAEDLETLIGLLDSIRSKEDA